jgi:2-polyprenyl-3-methyl-5-hydroxy-6-metoxy-1,4-benzoquinol methylase
VSTELSEFNRERFAERRFEARESRLRKALELLAAERSRGRLLDVAAGSGIAAQAAAGQGWEVSALDISEELLEQIRARGVEDARRHDLSDGPLPYDDGTFGAVFAGEIIEHLVDTAGFLLELGRVLRPGGVAVITTPNLASFENRVRLLLGRYPRWMDHELGGEGHVRYYTAATLRSQLAANGFTVEALRGNWVPFLPQSRVNDLNLPALARTGDIWPSLSQALVVKARLGGPPSATAGPGSPTG